MENYKWYELQAEKKKEIHTVKLMKTDDDETRSREISEYKRERKKKEKGQTTSDIFIETTKARRQKIPSKRTWLLTKNSIPAIKTHDEVTAIKTVWYQSNDKKMTNLIGQGHETDLHMYAYLIYCKGDIAEQWGIFSINSTESIN